MDNKSVNNLRALALSPEDVMALTGKISACKEEDMEFDNPDINASELLEFITESNNEAIYQTYNDVADVMDRLDDLLCTYDYEIATLEGCKAKIDKLIDKYMRYMRMIDACMEILDSEGYEEEDE